MGRSGFARAHMRRPFLAIIVRKRTVSQDIDVGTKVEE
jgi:hypothetical protein